MKITWWLYVSGFGILMLVASLLANGIQFRLAEDAGHEDLYAPEWIIIWHWLSVGVIVLGVVGMTIGVIR